MLERTDSSGGTIRRYGIALGLLLLGVAIYGGTALWGGRTGSPDSAYFDLVAEGFLKGRLYLEDPPNTEDLTCHGGRWYAAFPPLPAILLTPWVAVAGLERTSTVAFSVLIGAGNVALIFLLLASLAARGWTRLGTTDNLWLTAMFAVGTVHWYVATDGQVWFLAQTCTVFFTVLALFLAAQGYAGGWSGAALALAMGARPHVALIWPVLAGLAAEHLRDAAGRLDRRRWLRWCALSTVPMAAAVAGLLAYNHARFGNPLDFGYAAMVVDPPLAERIRIYGVFNIHYLPRNLRAMLFGLPLFLDDGGVVPDPEGMSLFFTTPALVYVFRARPLRPVVLGAWLAVGAVLVPLLTYNNTGYWQFGYRFALDFVGPALVLVAVGCRGRVTWVMRGLIATGTIVNLWGVRWWY